MPIKILIADDHDLVRFGFKSALETEPNFEVIGEARNGRQAVRIALDLNPDIVLMDLSMPELNGLDATLEIHKQNPEIGIIGLSMFSEHSQIEQMFRNGARGYIVKDCSFSEFKRCIEHVACGKTYLWPSVTKEFVEKALNSNSEHKESSSEVKLTFREKEVLQLIAEGKTNKEIASILSVGVKTVETHRRALMDKLDIRTVAGLTKYALRKKITSLDF